jgi:acyl carrier protein
VAYEVALYVREILNREPLCIIASGTESPKYAMAQTIILDDDGKCIVSDEELVKKMIEFELVTPSFADNKNFIDYYIPTYKNDLVMMSKYEYTENAKFNCPIYVMYGNKDKTIRQFAVHDWDNFTTNRVSYHEFDGGHFYLTDIKEVMAKELASYINQSKTLTLKGEKTMDYVGIIKELFKNILEVEEEVTTESSFFELGGNSLKASYLASELLEKHNIEILISDIYENETVQELANFITSSKND